MIPAHHRARSTGRGSCPPERSGGFTLLELLIVVVIIGVLCAIAIPAYNSYINNARLTLAQGALDTIRKTLESYHADYQEYPGSIDFTTGRDGLGRTVFESQLIDQLNSDLTSIDSYITADSSYTLVATAKDDKQTVMTLTPQDLSY